MIRILLAFALLLTASPTLAQSTADFASGCAADDGSDRCSTAAIKAWHEKYGLSSIEQMAKDGTFVRRVLYVDGYGNDRIAISAIRAKGASPVIEIRQPRRGQAAPAVRTRPISEALWNRMLADSTAAHRRYKPEAGANPDEINLCMHAWAWRFEAADPRRLAQYVVAQQWENAETRATTASACENGPTDAFATALAEAASASFGECSALDPAVEGNAIDLLGSCLRLSGDSIAAAHARSAASNLDLLLFRHRHQGGWSDALRSDGALASETLKERGDVDWATLKEMSGPAEFLHFSIDSTDGIDSQQARMTGTLQWRPTANRRPGEENETLSRKIELMWVQQTGHWVIDDIRVSRTIIHER